MLRATRTVNHEQPARFHTLRRMFSRLYEEHMHLEPINRSVIPSYFSTELSQKFLFLIHQPIKFAGNIIIGGIETIRETWTTDENIASRSSPDSQREYWIGWLRAIEIGLYQRKRERQSWPRPSCLELKLRYLTPSAILTSFDQTKPVVFESFQRAQSKSRPFRY